MGKIVGVLVFAGFRHSAAASCTLRMQTSTASLPMLCPACLSLFHPVAGMDADCLLEMTEASFISEIVFVEGLSAGRRTGQAWWRLSALAFSPGFL